MLPVPKEKKRNKYWKNMFTTLLVKGNSSSLSRGCSQYTKATADAKLKKRHEKQIGPFLALL